MTYPKLLRFTCDVCRRGPLEVKVLDETHEKNIRVMVARDIFGIHEAATGCKGRQLELDESTQREMLKVVSDQLIYGMGFFRRGADGSFEHIPFEEGVRLKELDASIGSLAFGVS